jgi:outer membrane protein assembly factor BamB
MTRLIRRAATTVAAAVLLAVPAMSAATASATRPDQTYINWPGYLNGVAHSSYQPDATSITTATAPSLVRAWTWKPGPATMSGQPGASLYSSPTVYDGVIYIGSDTGDFYAISESTGTVIWQDFLGFVPHLTCPGARGISDTATVETDPSTGVLTVYVSGGNGYLYALNAATGATIWQSVIALPSTTKNDYYDWSSPTVVNGNIYIGVSSQCNDPNILGGLKEYNQTTGAEENFWQTKTAGPDGASIWDTASADAKGNVYVGTGGGPGIAETIVRLQPKTLAEKSHWTVPKDQRVGYDSDFGGSNTQFTATLNGVSTPMLGECNKNGIFYALKDGAIGAGPVWEDDLGVGSTHPPICAAAAIWNGTNLWLAGPPTTIDGTAYQGSIEEVDPATGVPIWQTGLAGPPIGSPSMDGSGVIAVQTYTDAGDYLIDASTGAILAHLNTGVEWGQPVFADNYLLIPTQGKGLWAMVDPAATPKHG